jgi:hypothetical protein
LTFAWFEVNGLFLRFMAGIKERKSFTVGQRFLYGERHLAFLGFNSVPL